MILQPLAEPTEKVFNLFLCVSLLKSTFSLNKSLEQQTCLVEFIFGMQIHCYHMTYILHNSVSQKIQKSLNNNRKDINVVQSLSTFLFNVSNKDLCKSSNLLCNNLLYHELRSKNQKPLKSGFLEMELSQNYNI